MDYPCKGRIGLLVNLGVAWMLHRSEQSLNIRWAMLHVTGDLLDLFRGVALTLQSGGPRF